MYTPNLVTWMQRDPAEEGLNLYENVESNPVNLTDPTGRAGVPNSEGQAASRPNPSAGGADG